MTAVKIDFQVTYRRDLSVAAFATSVGKAQPQTEYKVTVSDFTNTNTNTNRKAQPQTEYEVNLKNIIRFDKCIKTGIFDQCYC